MGTIEQLLDAIMATRRTSRELAIADDPRAAIAADDASMKAVLDLVEQLRTAL